jgi:replicative DNA helicase
MTNLIDVEAELSVLKAMLFSESVRDEHIGNVYPDDFGHDANSKIYSTIESLHVSGQPVTGSVVLRESGLPKEALMNVASSDYSAYSLPHYIKSLKEKTALRGLYTVAKETIAGIEGQVESLALIKAVENTLFRLSGGRSAVGPTLIRDLIPEALRALEMRFNKKEIPGIPSGFEKLDECLGGFVGGNLVIPAGRSSMGKTAFSLSLAINAAQRGYPVVFFSLEMSRQEIMDRLISVLSGVPLFQVRSGLMKKEDYSRVGASIGLIDGLPVYIDDRGLGLSQIMAEIRRLVRVNQAKMAIIDYLQIIPEQKQKGESRVELIGRVSMALKQLAKSLNIPILALSQLSRDCDKRHGNHRPIMSDLRDSGNIEQDADAVLFVYRESVYDDKVPEEQAEIIIAKNRNGPTGGIDVRFNKELATFEDKKPEVKSEF